ncbi:S26 family signal peptidase [Sphingobium sp.]|uniref:S26 family signal peptidase n=1 Tax=Sphingobium sp. TaxID=1912891 RepID=UPI003B3A63D2
MIGTALGVLPVIALCLFDPAPRLVWNATASAPVGLYSVTPGRLPQTGQLALIEPARPLGLWLARRHYLPLGVPLIKRIAATAGQTVCRTGDLVTIDGRHAALAKAHDRAGRLMPIWTGCRMLGSEEMLLLNAAEDSLDGRYLGPLPTTGMIGTVHPVLTRATPQGDFLWQGVGR